MEGFEDEIDDADKKMQTSRSHVAFKFLTSLDGATQQYAHNDFKKGNIYYESDSDLSNSERNEGLEPP